MEAIWFKLRRLSHWFTQSAVVVCLSFRWRYIPDAFQQPVLIEPGHPFQRCQFHCFTTFPRCPPVDQFGFVQAVDRFRQCVVIAVTATANGRFNARLSQSLGVTDRDVLRSSVAVMNQRIGWLVIPPENWSSYK